METILFILSFIVIICFSIVYIRLFYITYKSRGTCLKRGYYDDEIKKDIKNDEDSYLKKHKNNNKTYATYYNEKYNKKKKKNKIISGIVDGFEILIILSCLTLFIYLSFNSGVNFVNGSGLLLIETGSMSEVNDYNSYLKDEKNGSYKYIDTRIGQYDLIGVNKFDESEDLTLYDIVAFKMDDEIIVHRLIDINEVDGEKKYTFRGDANNSSLADEINVSEDKIIGIYNGFKSTFLGYFTVFIKSGVGTVSIFATFLCIMVYMYFYDKNMKVYNEKYLTFLNEMDDSRTQENEEVL